MKIFVLVFAALGVICAPASAQAVKLWKWIDKNGHVVYSESPPASDATKAEEKQIDPKQNVVETEVPPPSPDSPPGASPPPTVPASTRAQDRSSLWRGVAAGADAPITPPPAPPSGAR